MRSSQNFSGLSFLYKYDSLTYCFTLIIADVVGFSMLENSNTLLSRCFHKFSLVTSKVICWESESENEVVGVSRREVDGSRNLFGTWNWTWNSCVSNIINSSKTNCRALSASVSISKPAFLNYVSTNVYLATVLLISWPPNILSKTSNNFIFSLLATFELELQLLNAVCMPRIRGTM